MTKKAYFILFLTVSLISLSILFAFAQEPEVAVNPAEVTEAAEEEMLWVWGQVVSADITNNSITVKYFDYETDEEKEIVINTDDKTTYENIKSIIEIKPQDTVSIDYVIANDKNLAKNISLEKPEEEQPLPKESTPEIVPKDLQTDIPPKGY